MASPELLSPEEAVPVLDPSIVSLLESQQGLVTRRSLLDIPEGEATLRRLVRAGVWCRLDAGLYGPAGMPMTWPRRLMACVLLAPAGSLVSHRAFAHLIGVGGFDRAPAPELTIPRGSTFRRDDVIVHESTDLALAVPWRVDGIPCTGKLRLAMDLGGVVSPSRFTHSIRELRHGHGITAESLLRTYLRHKRRGRNGGAALRDWLDRSFHVDGVAESGLEQLAVDAILDAQLPAPVLQHWVETPAGPYRLDLAYPQLRLCVEVDGRQHLDPDIAAHDAARTAALEAAGWTVLRIRSWCFASDLAEALAVLRRHLVDS